MNLVLFMTRDVSLEKWRRIGSLERETALYAALRDRYDVKVRFVTWGKNAEDDRIAKKLGFEGACWRSMPRLRTFYNQVLPFWHQRWLRWADIIKTNQILGADVALRAAQIWRKPLIVRQGYLYSEFVEKNKGEDSIEAVWARKTERKVFTRANAICITTERNRCDILKRYNLDPQVVQVIPNYVDTDIFVPQHKTRPSVGRIVYVGRLCDEQKNVSALVEAATGLSLELWLVGEGDLRTKFNNLPMEHKLKCLGSQPNTALPSILNQCDIFVLPSFFEGHPKALIEAMSCGMPVVTTNVPGIQELIRHGETGWLVEPDAKSLREGIEYLYHHRDLAWRMGCNAREYVLENFSLERIVESEWEMCQKVLSQKRQRS